ncbi:hypothetical protein TNCV_3882381 [Trichonephila clavipes]|nr:hypothetical protein TNCV_3882381 [Trichonephila clavipes]
MTAASYKTEECCSGYILSLYPSTRCLRRTGKPRIKESGCNPTKKKKVEHGAKNSFAKATKVWMDDLSLETFVFGSPAGAKCEDFMTSFISWNCRGLSRTPDTLRGSPSLGDPRALRIEWNEVVSDGVFTIGMMTQRTAPGKTGTLERGFELLRTCGLVKWGLEDAAM